MINGTIRQRADYHSVGDKLYYFDPVTFEMIKNEDITIEGIQYHIDEKGCGFIKGNGRFQNEKGSAVGVKTTGNTVQSYRGRRI